MGRLCEYATGLPSDRADAPSVDALLYAPAAQSKSRSITDTRDYAANQQRIAIRSIYVSAGSNEDGAPIAWDTANTANTQPTVNTWYASAT